MNNKFNFLFKKPNGDKYHCMYNININILMMLKGISIRNTSCLFHPLLHKSNLKNLTVFFYE